MRKDAVCAFRTVALFMERARTVMVVLAVFAFGALTFPLILAEELGVGDRFSSARRTSTFSLGFAAFATT